MFFNVLIVVLCLIFFYFVIKVVLVIVIVYVVKLFENNGLNVVWEIFVGWVVIMVNIKVSKLFYNIVLILIEVLF